MIKFLLTFGVGISVGVVGKIGYDRWRSPPVGGASVFHDKLYGQIVPGPAGTSTMGGGVPKAGFATAPLYEWVYKIGQGDTAGGIAEAVTGHDVRYQELLLANPTLPTVGEAGIYAGDDAWDFAPGAFREGVHVLLPLAWNPYIDQTGVPRGRAVPYPDDPRRLIASPPPGSSAPPLGAPVNSAPVGELSEGAMGTLAAAPPPVTAGSTADIAGVAPYDKPFLHGKAA